jgi:hypothetical protein
MYHRATQLKGIRISAITHIKDKRVILGIFNSSDLIVYDYGRKIKLAALPNPSGNK